MLVSGTLREQVRCSSAWRASTAAFVLATECLRGARSHEGAHATRALAPGPALNQLRLLPAAPRRLRRASSLSIAEQSG